MQVKSKEVLNNRLKINLTTLKSVDKFSQIIQAELKKRGLKQKDLAKHLNKSESAFSQMLANETFNKDIMIRISQFFGVDLNFFSRDIVSKAITPPSDSKEVNNNIKHLEEIIKARDETIKVLERIIESKDETIAILKNQVKN